MAGFGAKVRDWFNGGDPQGHIKIRHWLRGYDDRPEGYTYGMMGPAMVLSVVATILVPDADSVVAVEQLVDKIGGETLVVIVHQTKVSSSL